MRLKENVRVFLYFMTLLWVYNFINFIFFIFEILIMYMEKLVDFDWLGIV